MTGAEAVVKALLENKVEFIFGIPGVQNLELYNELSFSNIRNILVTNEMGASFMADGYARVGGRPGVCLSISGPGLTNMLTGLAETRCDSTPLVVIISLPAERKNKSFKAHELDDEGIARKVVKEYIKVKSTGEIRWAVNMAFHNAISGEPGPVIVAISEDMLKSRVQNEKMFSLESGDDKKNLQELDNAVAMIKSASRIGLYCGGGAIEAAEEVRILAGMLGASICTTISGRGIIPERDGNCIGFGDGIDGLQKIKDFFEDNDLIIAMGCRFSYIPTMNWIFNQPKKMIQIDTEINNIGRNYDVDIAIEGKCKETISEIIIRLKKGKLTALQKRTNREPDNLPTNEPVEEDFVSPDNFFRMVREEASDETILVTDCGNHQLWAVTDYRILRPRTFISPIDYQAMGFGVPAAIGAKLARPNAPVVCVTGDGGFLMSGFEILTALKENIIVIFIVFNDNFLGLIRDIQKKHYRHEEGVDLRMPDFESLSDSFGIPYFEVKGDTDSRPVMKSVLKNGGPCLVNVNIRYEKLAPYVNQTYWSSFLRLTLSEKIEAILRMTKVHLKNKIRDKT